MNVLFLISDYLIQPLGVAYLSAALRQNGHLTEVAALRDVRRQNMLLRDFKPRILCLSSATGQHTHFLRRARQIRGEYPKLFVLAGGPHATFYPEFVYERGIDAACRGEGEIALPAMAAFVERNGFLPERMANWWVKQPDGSVTVSDVGPLIGDLDTLPPPDRDVFDRARPGIRRQTAYVMASRGCPYKCGYCFNHAYQELYRGKGGMCRRRGVGNLLEELDILKRRYPLQIFVFQDDTFNLDKDWLGEFSDRYARRTGVPFHCHLRAELLDEDTVRMLRRAGCLSVKLGLEAGRDRVRNGILNRDMRLEDFENACGLLHKYGIRFAIENILAVPGSTLEDDLFTYEVNNRARPHYAFATLLQVYPRTRIAEYARQHGFADSSRAEFPVTFYQNSGLNIEDKESRGRLRSLFALGVGLRLPARTVRRLARPRLRRVYEILDRLWKGYCLRFRIYPYSQDLFGFLRETAQYLQNKYY
ncbi:MAG: radical SAM protein [Syntrophobacteraceae bacterium]